MIYICINSEDKETANQYVKENLDIQGGENTFIENFVGKCLISLPDSGSPYVEGMKEHFGYTEELPDNLIPLE